MIGTPSYIAPEIWEGENASLATDQYALACVLAEMLTGRVLFGGTTPAIMKKHLLEEPSLPEKLSEDVPAGFFLDTLRRALGKKAEGRYAGITEFVAGLKEPMKIIPLQAMETREQSDAQKRGVRNWLKEQKRLSHGKHQTPNRKRTRKR